MKAGTRLTASLVGSRVRINMPGRPATTYYPAIQPVEFEGLAVGFTPVDKDRPGSMAYLEVKHPDTGRVDGYPAHMVTVLD